MAQPSYLILSFALLLSQAAAQDRPDDGHQRPSNSPRPTAPAKDQRPEAVVLKAIKANPVCAPYQIKTAWQKGVVVISGRVGSNAVHDQVVRIAIDLDYPFRENLIIDTSEGLRVAALKPEPAAQGRRSSASSSRLSSIPRPASPPSLLGRGVDPRFATEPPLVSYPPGWKRPVRDQRGSLTQTPVPSDSVASPERQKALLEETHRRVATPEVQALLKAESSRIEAANEDELDRHRLERAEQVATESAGTEPAPHDSAIAAIGAIAIFAVILGFSLVLYFMPSIVALSRGHHDAAAIVALNLFLGWTFVGWVVAICWALTQVRRNDDHRSYVHHSKSGRESVAPPSWLS